MTDMTHNDRELAIALLRAWRDDNDDEQARYLVERSPERARRMVNAARAAGISELASKAVPGEDDLVSDIASAILAAVGLNKAQATEGTKAFAMRDAHSSFSVIKPILSTLTAQADAARADAERLREALLEIEKLETGHVPTTGENDQMIITQSGRIARAALAAREG